MLWLNLIDPLTFLSLVAKVILKNGAIYCQCKSQKSVFICGRRATVSLSLQENVICLHALMLRGGRCSDSPAVQQSVRSQTAALTQ